MSRSRLPIGAALAVAAVAFGGVLVFQQFLAGDSVPTLTLPPLATATLADGTTSDPSASAVAGSSTDALDATPAGLAGSWSVGDGSVVGYRVREQLASLQALSDAVGRTSAVTGTATLEAAGGTVKVTAATFEADLTQLTSDEGRRDNRIRTIGLQSSQFPTATFTLTTPIEVPPAALTGTAVDVSISGDLTIHGVTKSVTITGQAQLNGDRIELAASLTFPFSDFGMTPPNIAGFVSVQDKATLEVLLSLARA
jgi:polyisoprenoid-binding protein YceI